jgi:adenylate cyclase
LSSEHVERRLAAILAADVAGSCRLIGIDEEGALTQLKALRKSLFDPKISDHRGRIVKNTGDGALVEFASVVDAVRCADEIQRGVAEQNTDVLQDKRIEFRIGIHVGDIIIERDDIFGDGVNIAVRLEGIAEPGGICISDDAHRQVRGKVESIFEEMGAQTLRNIAEPMRVWRIRKNSISSSQVVVLYPTLDGPSIAILPFQNLSDDPDQDYFVYGMVDEITTALSRFNSLVVIARNSSSAYKGKVVDIRQIGRELGVRYVLEGSVRKAAGKICIISQWIDAATGMHLWADRLEGDLSDIFALQDRMVESASLPFIQNCFTPKSIWLCVGRTTSTLTTFVFEQYSTSSHGPGADRPRPFGLPLAHWRLTLSTVLPRRLSRIATSEIYFRDRRPIRIRKLQKDCGFSGWRSVSTGTTMWH